MVKFYHNDSFAVRPEKAWDHCRNAHPAPGDNLYLVAYDIADPTRLRRVAACCLDHGVRVQKSLFECRLSRAQFEVFQQKLLTLIDPGEDSLLAYPLHGALRDDILCAGTARRKQPLVAFFG